MLIYICECSLSRRARLAGVSFRVWGNDVMRDGCCLMQAARLHYSTNASTCTANHPTFQQIRHQGYLTRSLPIATCCLWASLCHTNLASLPRALLRLITTSHCFRGCNLRPYDVQALLTLNLTLLISSCQTHAPDPLDHSLCRAQQPQLHMT